MRWPFTIWQTSGTKPPRCEEADPFRAGWEDRMALARRMSTHAGSGWGPCPCARCMEYRDGWRTADRQRISDSTRAMQERNAPRTAAPEVPAPAPARDGPAADILDILKHLGCTGATAQAGEFLRIDCRFILRDARAIADPQPWLAAAMEWPELAEREIESLRALVAKHRADREEYLASWGRWLDEHGGLDAVDWLRAYAEANPANPDGPELHERVISNIDGRCRQAADEIESLRSMLAIRTEERDSVRRGVCYLQTASVREAKSLARERGWDCFQEEDNA